MAALSLALIAVATAVDAASPPASGIEDLSTQLRLAARRRPAAARPAGSTRTSHGCAVHAPPAPVLAVLDAEIASWLRAHGHADEPVKALRAIDVVVHVITSGDSGAVSLQSIDRQLATLDAAYAAAGISFRRAAVTRTSNARWFAMTRGSAAEREAKTRLAWDSRFYLNLYTARPEGGAPGWATFPWDRPGDPALDGVVVRHDLLPLPGDGGRNGHSAVHDVAHWLGLHSTSDACLHRFTPAQLSRISAMVATYRESL